MSTSVGAKEELCMVLSRKGRRTKKKRGATAGTGMHRGVFGEVTGASKEPVLAEGDYADVIALLGMEATWEPKFKISCQSPRLYITVFPGHAPWSKNISILHKSYTIQNHPPSYPFFYINH